MSVPAIIMLAVVFAVGVPSAWRNPTAAALVIAWIAGQCYYLITGDNLPVEFYLFPDIFVLAVIMAKDEHRNQRPYRGISHHLKFSVLDRSPADRVIMLIFPVMWVLYVAPLHPYYTWWSLWALVIVQIFAAAWEAFCSPKTVNRKASQPTPIIDRHLVVIPFPVQRRGADAVRKTPDHSGAMLTANGGGGGG